jgi:hypothetical protein
MRLSHVRLDLPSGASVVPPIFPMAQVGSSGPSGSILMTCPVSPDR